MSILSLNNVVKQYHNHRAVDSISFNVPKNKIFGLLGPNGAGKTSLIRIITSITGADSGEILIDGESLNPDHIRDIGYMPEERGLYKKMKVGEQLMYLAQLKGLSKQEAKAGIMYWLEKFDIKDWWNKKIEELSKGMQQKIQFIATVVHKPKLLILDEPFSGLDPLNTNLIKDEIAQLNREGTSIIFSTHRMEQVEEICEEIVLINNGQVILEGNVNDVKHKFKQNIYQIQTEGVKPDYSGFDILSNEGDTVTVQVENKEDSNQILQHAIKSGAHVISFSEILPSLNEIFIQQVENRDTNS